MYVQKPTKQDMSDMPLSLVHARSGPLAVDVQERMRAARGVRSHVHMAHERCAGRRRQ